MLRGGRSAAALVRSLATPEKAENREEEEEAAAAEEEEEEEEEEDGGEGPSEAGRAKVRWCRITVR